MSTSTFKTKISTDSLLQEEKELLKKKNRIEKILITKEYLKKSPEERTISECEFIASMLKEVKFLEQYQDRMDFLMRVAKKVTLKRYEPKSIIFKQGDIGDAFYIILAGQVTIYIDNPSEHKHFSQLKEINKLGQGDTFGELALLYDAKRTATIISDEMTELLYLEKSIFRTLLGVLAVSHVNEIMQFFARHPIFSTLPTSDIVQLAGKATITKFPIDFLFIKEGEVRTEVFFIKEGMIKLLREVKFKGNSIEEFLTNVDGPELSAPSPKDIQQSEYFEIVMEVDSLEKGGTINDFAILNHKPSEFSAISVLPSTVISLDFDIIEKTLSAIHLQRYRRTLKTYPVDEELRRMFYLENRWKKYKSQYLKYIDYNKSLDKMYHSSGFDTNFRVPKQTSHEDKLYQPLLTDSEADNLVKTNIYTILFHMQEEEKKDRSQILLKELAKKKQIYSSNESLPSSRKLKLLTSYGHIATPRQKPTKQHPFLNISKPSEQKTLLLPRLLRGIPP